MRSFLGIASLRQRPGLWLSLPCRCPDPTSLILNKALVLLLPYLPYAYDLAWLGYVGFYFIAALLSSGF